MKKDTAIKEDTKARQFAAVQKVEINKTSSGTSLWVPEDIAETDELSVTENGVYCAYDDNVFGYSQVVVNVSESLNDRSEKDKAIGKITGTNPDTGDTESYGVDEDGNLTKEVYPSGLPQAIHIVIAPTKKTYNEGDSLDFTGIHVYLLDGEGHQWTSDEYPTGEIPFNELIFPENTASADSDYGKTDIRVDRFTIKAPMNVTLVTDGSQIMVSGTGSPVVLDDDNYGNCVATSLSDGSTGYLVIIASKNDISRKGFEALDGMSSGSFGYDQGATYDGKHAYGVSIEEGFSSYTKSASIPTSANQTANLGAIIWAMVYGWGGAGGGGTGHVPVQWMRSDGETLEDTYDITVSASGSSSGDSSSGSSSSGGEHSGGDF